MYRQLDDVMELCSKLSKTEQIKVTVDNSRQGVAVAGGGAFLGAILGGPPGIFIGAVVGGAVGWWMARGKFRPLHQIIMEMSPEQQRKLCSEVMEELGNLAWDNVAGLILSVMRESSLKMKILSIIISFATKQLKVKIAS
ncbi:protein C19orf12 homolog [Sinocyclocheilus grahami]|uniref:protein C19orf12 homolog n=1 Tax=Sinocyclocheilus grahami TaxID=75366 RepID=UPI0007AC88A6|nr:PREDICTED: protein C19orf12 homolog [Sinocyclocheilus grahami]